MSRSPAQSSQLRLSGSPARTPNQDVTHISNIPVSRRYRPLFSLSSRSRCFFSYFCFSKHPCLEYIQQDDFEYYPYFVLHRNIDCCLLHLPLDTFTWSKSNYPREEENTDKPGQHCIQPKRTAKRRTERTSATKEEGISSVRSHSRNWVRTNRRCPLQVHWILVSRPHTLNITSLRLARPLFRLLLVTQSTTSGR